MVMMGSYKQRYNNFLNLIDNGTLKSNWNSVLGYLIKQYEFNPPRLKDILEENKIYVAEETIFDAIKENQFSPELREPLLNTLLELHYDGDAEDQKFTPKIMEFLTDTNVQHIDYSTAEFPELLNKNREYEKMGEIYRECDEHVFAFIQYLKDSWDISLANESDFNTIFKPQYSEYQNIGKNTPINFLNIITDIPDDSVRKLLDELQDMGLFKQILLQKYEKEFYKSPKTTLDSLTEEIDTIELKQNGGDYLEYLNKIQTDLYAIQNELNFAYSFPVPGQRTLKERFDEE